MTDVTEEWCDACDMTKAFCVHGNPPKEQPRTPLLAVGPTIEAQIGSECPGCGDRIHPEDTITLSDEGWVHADEVSSDKPTTTDSGLFEGII